MTHGRAGWVMLETTWGMAIISLMATTLAIAVGRQRLDLQKLDQSRAAARAAEFAATSMQTDSLVQQSRCAITILPDQSDAAEFVWVRIQSSIDGKQCELISLVPMRAAKVKP